MILMTHEWIMNDAEWFLKPTKSLPRLPLSRSKHRKLSESSLNDSHICSRWVPRWSQQVVLTMAESNPWSCCIGPCDLWFLSFSNKKCFFSIFFFLNECVWSSCSDHMGPKSTQLYTSRCTPFGWSGTLVWAKWSDVPFWEDSENCTKMHRAKFKTPNGDVSWCMMYLQRICSVHCAQYPNDPKCTKTFWRHKREVQKIKLTEHEFTPMATDDACNAQALRIFQHRRDAKSWSVRSRHETTSTSRLHLVNPSLRLWLDVLS